MTELYAQIRGDEKEVLIPTDDTKAHLQAIVQTMRSHGFKIVTGEGGEKRVINPYTKECEVIYRIKEQA